MVSHSLVFNPNIKKILILSPVVILSYKYLYLHYFKRDWTQPNFDDIIIIDSRYLEVF